MTCTACQRRPAPVSGRSELCAECRALAREIRRASDGIVTRRPKFAPEVKKRRGQRGPDKRNKWGQWKIAA